MELFGQLLHCYAPGCGSLHFNWNGKEYPYPSTGRKVKRWHVLRFLRTKEGKRLVSKGWRLYNLNTQWQLVRKVVCKNKNTLCMDGVCYTYALKDNKRQEVWDCDLTVYTKSQIS